MTSPTQPGTTPPEGCRNGSDNAMPNDVGPDLPVPLADHFQPGPSGQQAKAATNKHGTLNTAAYGVAARPAAALGTTRPAPGRA
jgi:hypothetical protein